MRIALQLLPWCAHCSEVTRPLAPLVVAWTGPGGRYRSICTAAARTAGAQPPAGPYFLSRACVTAVACETRVFACECLSVGRTSMSLRAACASNQRVVVVVRVRILSPHAPPPPPPPPSCPCTSGACPGRGRAAGWQVRCLSRHSFWQLQQLFFASFTTPLHGHWHARPPSSRPHLEGCGREAQVRVIIEADLHFFVSVCAPFQCCPQALSSRSPFVSARLDCSPVLPVLCCLLSIVANQAIRELLQTPARTAAPAVVGRSMAAVQVLAMSDAWPSAASWRPRRQCYEFVPGPHASSRSISPALVPNCHTRPLR